VEFFNNRIFVALFCKKWGYCEKSNHEGEINSIVSKNRDYIPKIVEPLNEAIIFRG